MVLLATLFVCLGGSPSDPAPTPSPPLAPTVQGSCPATCGGQTCEAYVESYSCASLEQSGCNCSGCPSCAQSSDPAPTPSVTEGLTPALRILDTKPPNMRSQSHQLEWPQTLPPFGKLSRPSNSTTERRQLGSCPATCYGQTCEDYPKSTCESLEAAGCDCSGCPRCTSAPTPPPRFTIFINLTVLKAAVDDWVDSEADALNTHGPISDWDVSRVTSLNVRCSHDETNLSSPHPADLPARASPCHQPL